MEKIKQRLNDFAQLKDYSKEKTHSLGVCLAKLIFDINHDERQVMAWEIVAQYFPADTELFSCREIIEEAAKTQLSPDPTKKDQQLINLSDGLTEMSLHIQMTKNNLEILKKIKKKTPSIKSATNALQELCNELDKRAGKRHNSH